MWTIGKVIESSPLILVALVHRFIQFHVASHTFQQDEWILTSSCMPHFFFETTPQTGYTAGPVLPRHPGPPREPVLGIFKELPCDVLPILGVFRKARKLANPGGHPLLGTERALLFFSNFRLLFVFRVRKKHGIYWLVAEPTHLKNMLVKMDHLLKVRDENNKYLKPPPSLCLYFAKKHVFFIAGDFSTEHL